MLQGDDAAEPDRDRGLLTVTIDMRATPDVTIECRAIADELAPRHPHFALVTIERLVLRTFEEFSDAAIRAYLPILVRRQVEARLRYADPDEPPALAI